MGFRCARAEGLVFGSDRRRVRCLASRTDGYLATMAGSEDTQKARAARGPEEGRGEIGCAGVAFWRWCGHATMSLSLPALCHLKDSGLRIELLQLQRLTILCLYNSVPQRRAASRLNPLLGPAVRWLNWPHMPTHGWLAPRRDLHQRHRRYPLRLLACQSSIDQSRPFRRA